MSKLAAAVLALYSYFLIETNLPDLPSRIPTHFNWAGQPDRWGSPHILWVLMGVQVLVAGLILAIPFLGRRFPQTVHLGTRNLSDYTPEQREYMIPLLEKMSVFMSVVTSLFFVYLIREMIRAAEVPHSLAHMGWALGLFLGTMFGLGLYFVRRMNDVVRRKQPR